MRDLAAMQRLAMALSGAQEPMQLAGDVTTPMDIYRRDGYSPRTSDPRIDLEIIRQTDQLVGRPREGAPPPVSYKPGATSTQSGLASLRAGLKKRGMSDREIDLAIQSYQRSRGLRVVP